MMIVIVIVLAIFLISLAGIITDHLEKRTKLNRAILKDQLELERLKHENFLLETEKLKVELEKMEKENNLLERK
jgi:cell division protein FtsL